MNKIIVAVSLLVLAFTAQSFINNKKVPTSSQNGKLVYEANCMSCHMEDGNGLEGVYPSLVKTGNLKDPVRLVKIILQGMRGPITVKGVKYDLEMAASNLTNQETADVINYIRNAWGNKAPLIKVTDVVAAKKATIKGYQPF